jgi:Pentapeptide repeats (8 copies)
VHLLAVTAAARKRVRRAATKWPDWTGFGTRTYEQADGEVVQPFKTAWDWLQLLIVPAVLALAVGIYNQMQTSQANSREDKQAAENRRQAAVANQDTIFQSYLGQMSTLMVAKKLLTSKPNSSVSEVGRILTSGFMSAMDGTRKAEVVRFLFRAHLLGNPRVYTGQPPGVPLIDLASADLQGAKLSGADIEDANLARADLTGADLTRANLQTTDLGSANLEHANLSEAILNAHANLGGADLTDANLTGASLVDANLKHAYLTGANLSGANLTGADLAGANFSGAIFDKTTCPNGKVTNTHC